VLFFSLIPPDTNLGLSLMDLLFGSILGVRGIDLVVMAVVMGVATVVILASRGAPAYASCDDELARSDGVKSGALELVLYLVAAVVVSVSAVVVGVILMAAYLVIPAATARLLARTLAEMTALSVVLGAVATVAGLVLSFVLDVPSGATIVLVQAALFVPAAVFARR